MSNGTSFGGGEYRGSTESGEATIELHDGSQRQVRFSVVEGAALFEGDIVLNRPGLETLGIGLSDPHALWPGRRVIYEIDSGLPQPERVRDAIRHWEERTLLTFKQRTSESDYIRFVRGAGCSAHVGRIGGVQRVWLGDACSLGNAIHEIGHAVGLWHEQSREDRDQFITIVWNNIRQEARKNFDQHILDGDDLGPYDYGSIMHYGAYAFAINPAQPTIITSNGQSIGQRTALSAGDIAAVAELYQDVPA